MSLVYNLKEAITAVCFHISKADSSSFIYKQGTLITYLLVYIDDLVLTSNQPQFLASIIDQLGDRFFLKDMGLLHFFLGVDVVPTKSGLFLSQLQYIHDLSTTNVSGAKEVSTPLSTSQTLHLIDGTSFVDNTIFQKVIGSLQYLSLTWPDMSFVVKKLS